MNVSKKIQVLGLFVAVVTVSVATNLATSCIASGIKEESVFKGNGFPVSYPRISTPQVDLTVAAEKSIHAVVHVKTKVPVEAPQFNGFNDPFFEYFFGRPQQPGTPKETPMQEGSGSGVIISTDGYIVTNNHVIDRSKEIEVTLNDNRSFKAKLVGADPNTDIALLKIEAENLPIMQFGNSDSLQVGEWVLAVGNPFNLTSTVTAGIVSAKARNINLINAQMKIESFIQTDAAVNPGNSGGALVNTRGELVGINTAIASQTGSYAGYAFAVPVSIVQKVVTDMRKFGAVQRAILGVSMMDITDKLAEEKKLKTMEGAYVAEIVENSAAEKAGIKKEDVIVAVNGVAVKSSAQLQEQIARYSPGDKVKVTLLRENKELTVQAELKNKMGNTAMVSSTAQIDVLGAEFRGLTEKLKTQLNLKNGLEVKSLTKGKFLESGMKVGFVIVKINNQSIKDIEDVTSAFESAMSTDDQFKVLNVAGVYPNGKVAYYAVNLAD